MGQRLGQVDHGGVLRVQVGEVRLMQGHRPVGARLPHHLRPEAAVQRVHRRRPHAPRRRHPGDHQGVDAGVCSVGASAVPKNAEAYCLVSTGSPGWGCRASAPQSPAASSAKAASAGTLRTNRPPAGQPAGHEGPGDLQHLPEALRGDQADGGALALEDRVGGHGRAVQHRRDVGQLDARLGARLADAGEHADRLVGRGGGGLGPPGAAAALLDQQDVGEGASDVDSEPVAHGVSSPRVRSVVQRIRRCGPPRRP
jgi:hypothetical protein